MAPAAARSWTLGSYLRFTSLDYPCGRALTFETYLVKSFFARSHI